MTRSSIREFYAGKTVLITGATGFVGKVLLEKLLYSCSDVEKIYIVLRERKRKESTILDVLKIPFVRMDFLDPERARKVREVEENERKMQKSVPDVMTVQERFEQLINSPVFSGTNRTAVPDRIAKIVALEGDITQAKFALSNEDYSKVLTANIIFNCAASINLNEPLGRAFNSNCEPLFHLMEMCENMKNLQAFVQVSTCYVQYPNEKTEERIYPIKMDLLSVRKLKSDLSAQEFEKICRDNFFEHREHSYIYTKALAENYCASFAHKLPIAIGRLALCAPSRYEPEVGFIDVVQITTMASLGGALGLVRAAYGKAEAKPSGIPVDTAANTLISISVLLAKSCNRLLPSSVPVYNISATCATWLEYFPIAYKTVTEYPSSNCIAPPPVVNKPYEQSWRITFYFYLISAFFASIYFEIAFRVFGIKADIWKKYKTYHWACTFIADWGNKEWHYDTDNFRQISKLMPAEDRVLFPTDTPTHMTDEVRTEFEDGILKAWLCVRKYVLHEDIEDVEYARWRLKWIKVRFYFFFAQYIIFLSIVVIAPPMFWYMYFSSEG